MDQTGSSIRPLHDPIRPKNKGITMKKFEPAMSITSMPAFLTNHKGIILTIVRMVLVGTTILGVSVSDTSVAMQLPNEVWIAARTDNPVNPVGTLIDPFDGSTAN